MLDQANNATIYDNAEAGKVTGRRINFKEPIKIEVDFAPDVYVDHLTFEADVDGYFVGTPHF